MNFQTLKAEYQSLGAGEVLAEKCSTIAMEAHEKKTAELLAELQRLTTDRDGWKKQAEDLSSQIAQHLPSLDAIQRANKRAEEAEARAKEAEAEHSKVTHEAAKMLAESQRATTEHVGIIDNLRDLLAKAMVARDKLSIENAEMGRWHARQGHEIDALKEERDKALARVPQRLGLHLSGETLPLSVLEGVVAIFGSGALVDIDGVAFVVGDARLSSPALHTWLLSVPLEVSDE